MGKKQTTNYFWMSLICFQFRCYHLLFVTPTNDKTKIGNLYLSIFESRSVYAFLYKCFIKDSLIYIREREREISLDHYEQYVFFPFLIYNTSIEI